MAVSTGCQGGSGAHTAGWAASMLPDMTFSYLYDYALPGCAITRLLVSARRPPGYSVRGSLHGSRIVCLLHKQN